LVYISNLKKENGIVQEIFLLNFAELGPMDKYEIRDLWKHKMIGKGKNWKGEVQSHETKVFRLKKI
jgi:alpha-galactosidase